jgi:glycosyltransferase involved in cell wall biosynthesis
MFQFQVNKVPPLVSIIIPTYNMGQWIGETLDSILAQPGNNYEVIVIDDGSTDNTRELIETRYADRVRYHYQPNRGRGAARNKGVEFARGDFIQFFDADDIMEPDALTRRLLFLQEHPEYAAAYGRVVMFKTETPETLWEAEQHRYYPSGDILKDEIHRPFLQTITTLIRREWVEDVGGMDEALQSNEDWHFWLKVAARGGLFTYVDGPPVARYRTRLEHQTASPIKHLLSGVQTLERIKPLAAERPDYPTLQLDYAMAHWQYGYGWALAREGHRRQGAWQILKSLRYNRAHFPAKSVQLLLTMILPTCQIDPAWRRLLTILKKERGD